MKSKFGWLVGGIVAFLIFAIAYMPAIQVIGRVDLPKMYRLAVSVAHYGRVRRKPSW